MGLTHGPHLSLYENDTGMVFNFALEMSFFMTQEFE